MCRVHLWPWPFTSISKLYFHHEFESGKMPLLFDRGIQNFGIWSYHHETTCCVHSVLNFHPSTNWPNKSQWNIFSLCFIILQESKKCARYCKFKYGNMKIVCLFVVLHPTFFSNCMRYINDSIFSWSQLTVNAHISWNALV